MGVGCVVCSYVSEMNVHQHSLSLWFNFPLNSTVHGELGQSAEVD